MTESNLTYHIPKHHTPAVIVGIKTAVDKTQSEGDELLEYEYKEQVKGFSDEATTSILARRAEIRSSRDGIVRTILVAKGDTISDENQALIEYEVCEHVTQYEGMCCSCYKLVPKDSKSHINITHDATSLSVSRSEAKRLEQDTVNRLLAEGKLSLIVDLDQTLIHATVGKAIDEWVNSQKGVPEDIRKFPLPDSPTPYYIKLSLYELHIYTMGTRNYAAAVANAIDPDGKFFSQRIVSRDENSNEYFVGAGDINADFLPKQAPVVTTLPGPEATATTPDSDDKATTSTTTETSTPETVAASDSPDSTKTLAGLEISASAATTPDKVEPDSEKVKTPSAGKPLTLEDNDHELRNILEILETIHERFYDAREQYLQGESRKQADVKAIIQDMKKTVLRGFNLVFSSIIPLGQDPERADIWRQAAIFGAECSHDLSSRVTHLVAAKPGTAKVAKALHRKTIKIVRPEWLYHSIGKWQRQEESQYLLPDVQGKKNRTSNSPAPTIDPPTTTEAEGANETGLEEDEDGDDEDDQGGISEGMDENHRPLSINKEEMNEHLKSVNWDDLDKEVEDFVGDLDDTDFDSDTSTQSVSRSDVNMEVDQNPTPALNLKRARIPRRSNLGATVTYASSDDDDDEHGNERGDHSPAVATILKPEGDNFDSSQQFGDESDGDMEEEGSDSNDSGIDAAREKKRPRLRAKRRRTIAGNGESLGEDNEEDSDGMGDIELLGESGAEGSAVEDDEEDDDDFLKDLENDIDAQLNESDEVDQGRNND
ncbi:Carboxy-terminal domain (CTD) phosphatase, partial [Lunasporangiospora selenospora]